MARQSMGLYSGMMSDYDRQHFANLIHEIAFKFQKGEIRRVDITQTREYVEFGEFVDQRPGLIYYSITLD